MTERKRSPLVVLAAALAAAACGGQDLSPPPAKAGPASNEAAGEPPWMSSPCKLVSLGDLLTVLPGRSFNYDLRSTYEDGRGQRSTSSCKSNLMTKTASVAEFGETVDAPVSVIVTIWTSPGEAEASDHGQHFVVSGFGEVDALDGHGESRIYLSTAVGGVTIRKGLTTATVSVDGRQLTEAEDQQAELSLAQQLAAKL